MTRWLHVPLTLLKTGDAIAELTIAGRRYLACVSFPCGLSALVAKPGETLRSGDRLAACATEGEDLDYSNRSGLVLRELVTHAEAWEPIDGISGPCDQIAFSYAPAPDYSATVIMTFAALAGKRSRELILRFKHVIVLTSEDEAPGGFVPAPEIKSLPKLGRGDNPNWTFPLMKLINSEPLRQYQMMRPPNPPLAHFFLVSMDNLVHVIACAEVEARWNTAI
jgi:hypothetical protein